MMQFSVLIGAFFIFAADAVLDPVVKNVVHIQTSQPPPDVTGVWKTKVLWKPRWLKEWKSIVQPVWRKVWGPVEIHEWVPVPKPPPNWNPNASSTPLLPSTSWEPDSSWKPADSQALLNTYQTIQESNETVSNGYNYPGPATESDLGTNESNYVFPRPPYPEIDSEYEVDSANPETANLVKFPNMLPDLPDHLVPPMMTSYSSNFLEPEKNTSAPLDLSIPTKKEVSPYASSLAHAILQDKLNQSRNITRPVGGLTEALFTNATTASPVRSTSSSSSPAVSQKSRSQSTTENPTVFIVTPVNSG